jgi:LacI family transcriptional regulator
VERTAAPTLEDVAVAAGVSRATASRVINGSRRVSPDAEAAVHAAIDTLRYVPNRAARSLAKRTTMAIALVVPENTERFFGDPYFAQVVQGIADVIAESDYVLSLQFSAPSAPSAKTVRYLLGGNVDGAIVVSHHSGDHFLAGLGDALPVVFGGRPLGEHGDASYYVDVDNVAAGGVATQHLLDAGRTRIGMVSGPLDMPAGVDRAAGWRAALAAVGAASDALVPADFTLTGGARGMTELLERRPDLDGVFVASDLMALGALSVLRSRGIRVPEDIAVVGFDDSPPALEAGLTTVRQPSREMGETIAGMLLGLLRGEAVQKVRVLDTELVVRDSA